MRTKKEIDHDYYLRNREKILARVAQYQKDYPESHRQASKEYQHRKYHNLKLIPIMGKIISSQKLGNEIIFKKNRLELIKKIAKRKTITKI